MEGLAFVRNAAFQDGFSPNARASGSCLGKNRHLPKEKSLLSEKHDSFLDREPIIIKCISTWTSYTKYFKRK